MIANVLIKSLAALGHSVTILKLGSIRPPRPTIFFRAVSTATTDNLAHGNRASESQ